MKISSGAQPYLLSLHHKLTATGAGDKTLLITNLPGSRRQIGQGSSSENYSNLQVFTGEKHSVTAQLWESYVYLKVIACPLSGVS